MTARAWRSLNLFYVALAAVFLYVPLFLLIVFSFNDGGTLAFPLSGFTLKWYRELWDTPELLRAAWNSVLLGAISSVVATVIGAMAAVGLMRFRFAGRNLLIMAAMLPLVVPSVVLGVTMLMGFAQINLPLSLWTVGMGHVVINLPVVILIVMARLSGLDANLEEAAMDLGATYLGAQWRVTLPLTLPALFAAFLTSFTTSFDEFALTFFLVGSEPTLPTYLYSQLRFPTRLPIVVAMASVVIVGSFLTVVFTEWLRRRGETQKANRVDSLAGDFAVDERRPGPAMRPNTPALERGSTPRGGK